MQLGGISTNVDVVLDNAFAEVYGPQILTTVSEPESITRPSCSAMDYCRRLGVRCLPAAVGSKAVWPEDMVSAQERYARAFMSTLAQAKASGTNVLMVTHSLGAYTALAVMPTHRGSRINEVEHGGMFLAACACSAPHRRMYRYSMPVCIGPKVTQDVLAKTLSGELRDHGDDCTPSTASVDDMSDTHSDNDSCSSSSDLSSSLQEPHESGTGGMSAAVPLGLERQADGASRLGCAPHGDALTSHWDVYTDSIKLIRVAHPGASACVGFLRSFLLQSTVPLSEYEQLLGQLPVPDDCSFLCKTSKIRTASFMGLPNSLASRAYDERSSGKAGRVPLPLLGGLHRGTSDSEFAPGACSSASPIERSALLRRRRKFGGSLEELPREPHSFAAVEAPTEFAAGAPAWKH